MAKTIGIQYNGEIGYKVPIKEVLDFLKIIISDDDFLNFRANEESLTNAEIIYNAYNLRTKIALNLYDKEGNPVKDASAINGELPCPQNLTLYIDVNDITTDILLSQSNVLVNDQQVIDFGSNDNEKAFILDANRFYKNVLLPDSKFLEEKQANIGSNIRRDNLMPTVLIWSKSLNEDGKFNNESIFNLTPFVQNISTTVGETGGNFNIQLSTLKCKFEFDDNGEPKGIWRPDGRSYMKFSENGKENFVFRNMVNDDGERRNENTYNKTYGQRFQANTVNGLNSRDRNFEDSGDGDKIRTETFFKNIISENDIIFISFSTNDDFTAKYLKNDFFVNNDTLTFFQGWDLIGLVDTNSIGMTFENSDTSNAISGRDLTKLLIEDGSYFFAKSFSNPDNTNSAFSNIDLPNRGDDNNASNIVIQEQKVSGINRLMTTGIIDVLYNPEARNVNFIMNLLMSRLSNIEICYDALFKNFTDNTEFTVPFYETVQATDEEENDKEKYFD